MRRGGILLTVLAAIAALAVGASIRLYTVFHTDIEDIKEEIKNTAAAYDDKQHGILNLLVVGIDELEAVHRSDTIILARIDLDTKKAAVMSIPRDTRVRIQGHKQYEKLNHAYAYGGIDLLRDTVINLTGVPVNYYLTVNYNAFPKIVDAVGGVDIDVEKRMRYTDKAQGLVIDIKPGMQHMNGAQGLKYVRFRMDAMGDIGRMKRQQEFAKAFVKKLETPAMIARLPELIELVLAEIQTDVPVKTALALAGQLKDMKLSDIRFFTMPGDPAYISGVSYFIPDLQKASRDMDPNYSEDGQTVAADKTPSGAPNEEEHLEALAPSVAELKAPIAVLNGTGIKGLAKRFTQQLEKAGVEVAFTGNAKHSGFEYCIVQYPEKGSSEAAKTLADICGIPRNLVRSANINYAAALVLGKKNHESVMAKVKALMDEKQ